MNENRKNRVFGFIGTLLFHAAVFLLLVLLALKTPLPLPGEEGVEVNLGNSETGMGLVQQPVSQPASASPPPAQPNKSNEDIVTQTTDESVALPPKTEKPAKPRPETPKPVVQPQAQPEPEPQKVDPRALFRGSGSQQNQGTSQGITGQPGDQGQTGGSPTSPNYQGQGGSGDGISFSLEGRSSISLPKPDYSSRDQGRVVVTIFVNRQGVVTRVVAGARGTTTTDPVLRKAAEEAALRARFSPDPNAPEEQVGTITYNFMLIN